LRPSGAFNGPNIDTTTTDMAGAFQLDAEQLGSYLVEAKKAGYQGAMHGVPADPSSLLVALDGGHRTRDVRLELAPPGSVTGVLVEEDTGNPISGVQLTAWNRWYLRGERVLLPKVGGTTSNAEGRFVWGGLPGGDYIYEVMPIPLLSSERRLKTAFTREEVAQTDLGYRNTLWPGGGRDIAATAALTVVPGTSQTLGTLRLKKERLYRLHLEFAGERCRDNGSLDVSLTGPLNGLRMGLGSVPCAGQVLLTKLSPGSYRVHVESGDTTAERALVSDEQVEVFDSNVSIVMTLTRKSEVDGRVSVADGAAKLAFDGIRVAIGQSVGDVNSEGLFRLVNGAQDDRPVVVSGVPSTHYVKLVRRSQLEIVLDDKPAMITGMVTTGEAPVERAFVAVLKAPFNTAAVPYEFQTASSDSSGRFQFGGLAPGKYLILAVPDAMRNALDEPLRLNALLGRASAVELDPRGYRNVTLELLVP
jgi:hypothetical protein